MKDSKLNENASGKLTELFSHCDKLTAWVEQRAKQGGDTLLITQFDRKTE